MEQPLGARAERPWHLVLAGGLLTTAVALLGVQWLDTHTDDFHIMGWYAYYVIPAGAILVGLLAGSGYGAASWLSGVKIGRGLLATVLAFQMGAYFGARYLEFRRLDLRYTDGRPLGFIEFLDLDARQFAWKQRDGSPGEPMGAWGYLFRGLELAGFVAGGLVLPLVLRSQPYCDGCQIYLRRRNLGLLPAGTSARKIKKSDGEAQAAYDREHAEGRERGQALLDELVAHAAAGRAAEVSRLLEPHAAGQQEYGRLTRRIAVSLASCPGCRTGHIEASALEGFGDRVQRTSLGRWDVSPGFVTDFLRS